MAKGSSKGYDEGHMRNVFALQFIGSLIFLIIVFTATAFGGSYPLAQWGGAAWKPVLYLIAAVGSIALFLLSFANLMEIKKSLAVGVMVISVITGISLVGLTYGNSSYYLVAILGFVLSFIGSAMAHHAHGIRNSRKDISHRFAAIKRGAFGYEFIGSIILILIVFTATNASYPGAAAGASWQPLAFSIGAIGSIVLFILAFANMGASKDLAEESLVTCIFVGISLLALTYGSLSFFLLTFLGVLLSLLGIGILLATKGVK